MNCTTCQHYALLKKPKINETCTVFGHCLKKPGSFYPVYIPDGGCKTWKAEPDKYVGYHITPYENLRSIAENGLIPQIGDRSKIVGETTPGIFLFRTLDDAYDGFLTWLGDNFAEDVDLMLLKVYFDEYECTAPWELFLKDAIPPDLINVLQKI